MKKSLFILVFLLVFVCFSFSSFALVEYENYRFPDWPTGYSSSEPLTIIYSSDLNTYYAVYCTYDVSKLASITSRSPNGYFLYYPYNGMRVFWWKPESNFSWQYLETSGNYSTSGLNFRLDLYNRQIIYSSANILDSRVSGDPVFFLQNNIDAFFAHATSIYSSYLPDLGQDEPSWWDNWGGLDDFWSSITNFVGEALSVFVSPLTSLGDAISDLAFNLGSGVSIIYNKLVEFFDSFNDRLISLFIPSSDYFQTKNDFLFALLNSRLGNYNDIISNLQSAFSQMANQNFEGIYLEFPEDFYLRGVAGKRFYVVDPVPVGAYRYRFRPWISGLMTFLTAFFCLRKVIIIIRGSPTL